MEPGLHSLSQFPYQGHAYLLNHQSPQERRHHYKSYDSGDHTPPLRQNFHHQRYKPHFRDHNYRYDQRRIKQYSPQILCNSLFPYCLMRLYFGSALTITVDSCKPPLRQTSLNPTISRVGQPNTIRSQKSSYKRTI